MKTLVLLTTCPDSETASHLAKTLISEHLAACVNIIPKIHSVYRWQDAVEETKEWLLIIKTLEEHYSVLEAKIQSLHPYQVPEIIALPVEKASASYLGWLATVCKREA